MDTYYVVEIIKALQNDPETISEDLYRVEWVYLQLLNSYPGAFPRMLQNRLASDPEFFSEVIRLVYRSKKELEPSNEPTEQDNALALNAYRLLDSWQTPPGMHSDGSFSGEQFRKWFENAKDTCTNTGHFEVALTHIGTVLFYSPPDPSGLWIDNAVAEVLNGKDVENMRKGFRMAIYNSRGAHIVDPTGKPERELAEKYRQMAEEIENAGYQRIASSLRSLAESYDYEADEIMADHKMDIKE